MNNTLRLAVGNLGLVAMLQAGGIVSDCSESSLRAALVGGGQVTFNCDGIIQLSQPLLITVDTQLDATGHTVSLSGSTSNRVCEVRSGAMLRLVNLAVVDGVGVQGGGIRCEAANLLAEDCVFAGNRAEGLAGLPGKIGEAGQGGAVFGLDSGISFVRCVFNNNSAMGGTGGTNVFLGARGGVAEGGAVWVAGGTCWVDACRFVSNSAVGGTGGAGVQGGLGGEAAGGGIFANTEVGELRNTLVSQCRSAGGRGGFGSVQNGAAGAALGGGVQVDGGNFRLAATTIAACQAVGGLGERAFGGGLANRGTLAAMNSTIASNVTALTAAGDSYGGGIYTQGFFTADYCTIGGNSCERSGVSTGGNLLNDGGYVALRATAFARSPAQYDIAGSVNDLGFNVSWDFSAPFTNSTSRRGVDPMLAPLADNGGPVPTMMLRVGSPCLDLVSAGTVPAGDARGWPRPDGNRPDAGAVEGVGLGPVLTLEFDPWTVRTGSVSMIRVTVQNPNSFPLSRVGVAKSVPAGFHVASDRAGQAGCGGAVEAAALGNQWSVVFPSLAPGQTCGFEIPIVASTTVTSLYGLFQTTSANLGESSGRSVGATVRALDAPLVHTIGTDRSNEGWYVLRGHVLLAGLPVTTYFEWGTNQLYGEHTAEQVLAPPLQEADVTAALSNLVAGFQFHARLVVKDEGGTWYGEDVVFASPSKGAGACLDFRGASKSWVRLDRGFADVQDNFTMEFWAQPSASIALPPEARSGSVVGMSMQFALYPAEGDRRYGKNHFGVGVSVGTNGLVVVEHGKDTLAPVLVHAGDLPAWTHVAVVYESNAPPRLYLNGKLARSGIATPDRIHHPSIEIGSSFDSAIGGYGYYSGLLDEVRIWSRALSALEVGSSVGQTVSGSELALEACLHMDEGAGSLLIDSTGNGYNGQVMGGPTWTPSAALLGSPLLVESMVVDRLPQAVTLRAMLYPNGQSGQIHFEWGANGILSFETPPQPLQPDLVTNLVTALLTGLEAGANYQFRAVLVSGEKTIRGELVSFTPRIALGGGQAIHFGTIADSLQQGAAFPSVAGEFTMEFWARAEAGRASTPEMKTGVYDLTSQRFVFYPQHGAVAYGASEVVAGVSVGTNGVSVFEHSDSFRPAVLVYGAPLLGWNHFAVVYHLGQPALYVNGKLVRYGLKSGRSVHPSADLGTSPSALYGGDLAFLGDLDEVRVWNVARTDDEVLADMNFSRTGSEPGLVLCYNFEQQAGAPVVDSAPPHRTPTLLGNPTPTESEARVNFPNILSTSVRAESSASVELMAEIQFYGFSGEAQFDYGIDSLDQHITVQVANPGSAPQQLKARLSGLIPGQHYQFRAVANSLAGSSASAATTFPIPYPGLRDALSFDGGTAHVVSDTAFPEVQSSFTMEAWVKPTALLNPLRESQDEVGWPAGQRFVFYPNQNGGEYGLMHSIAGLSVGLNGVAVIEHTAAGFTIPLYYATAVERWTHLALVYENGKPSLLVNGAWVRTGLPSRYTVHPGSSLGAVSTTWPTGPYAGLLDEVRYWSISRSPAEVAADLHRELVGNEPNLARYWRLNEGGASVVANYTERPDVGQVRGPVWVASTAPMGRPTFDNYRVVTTESAGIKLECWVSGNGQSGELRLDFGVGTNVIAQADPQAVNGGDRGRVLTFRIPSLEQSAWIWARPVIRYAGVEMAEAEIPLLTRRSNQGCGIDFDGISGTVEPPPELFSGLDGNFTIEFWCQPAADRWPTQESTQTGTELGTQRFVVFPGHGPTVYGLGFTTAGVSVGKNGVTVVEHGDFIWRAPLVHDQVLNGWNHVAVVYENGLPRLYLNGQWVRNGLANTGHVGPGFALGGGPSVLGTIGFFQGQVDEFRVWSRARTAGEIQAFFSRVLTSPEPDLVWALHADEGWGRVTADMVQPHRRAVLVGGVNWVNSLAPIGVFIPFSRQLDGSVLWQFLAEPLSECVLQRSEDFLEWSNVATNSASSLGRFEFREADVKSVPQRFYRLRKYP